MILGKLADVEQYERARKINVELWSSLLATSQQTLHNTPPADTLAAQLHAHQFKLLANQALWAATEVSTDVRWKYAAQRFFSESVLHRWQNLCQSGKRFQMNKFIAGLRHEHVVERSSLIAPLLAARTQSEIASTLERAVSCVVTKHEDLRLSRKHVGWDRYRLADDGPIRVWDRQMGAWMPETT